MKADEEAQGIEAELQQIQDEIDRRHTRVDDDFERQHNLEKIDQLRERKNKLQQRLERLRPGS